MKLTRQKMCIDPSGCEKIGCTNAHTSGHIPPRVQDIPQCKHGIKCTYFNCRFKHPKGFVAPQKHEQCKHGLDCTWLNCVFEHPKGYIIPDENVCRYGMRCTLITCEYEHPAGWKPACAKGNDCNHYIEVNGKPRGCIYNHDGEGPCGQALKMGKCFRRNCTYSHPKVKPKMCTNGVRCRRERCDFNHPAGTKSCRAEYEHGRCKREWCEAKHKKK